MPHDFVTAVLCVAALTTCAGGAGAAKSEGGARSWAELVDALKSDRSAEPARKALLEQARVYVDRGIVKRVYKYEDVGRYRSRLDGRAIPLEPEIRETFALAMADANACAVTSTELPALAAAYRLTGETVFKDRVIAQLEEMSSWSPLQRPGWTLYAPGNRLPPDGKDGNWLGTGAGVRAIADTLEIMPGSAVSTDLKGRLRKLLAAEIESIVDDWKTKRPWFVRSNNAITNQWALPTEGLVCACLVLGKDLHRDAYELGVKNLLAALDSHGKAGEFEEGVLYAQGTVTSMLSAARAMALSGDPRAIDHPFLRSFPTWAVHHLQPGRMLINCFDCTVRQGDDAYLNPVLGMSAICSGSSTACWGLKQVPGGPQTLPVVLGSVACHDVEATAPPLFASYERATMVNWRDSWSVDASGVWVRGGHALDQHDHQDRGHVNYIHRGKPILIEAGTPQYSSPSIKWAQSCEAHNVLQIGSNPAKKAPAPIAVTRLDVKGGEITVDATKCYEEARKWTRAVRWTADSVDVNDAVVLADGKAEIVTFRWHLGTREKATITGAGAKYEVSWPDAQLTLQGSEPLAVTQESVPDATLAAPGPGAADVHTCIIVRTQSNVSSLDLSTVVTP